MGVPDKIDGDRDQARVANRVRLAAELRLKGHTWARVAELVGYASPGAAHNAVMPYVRAQRDETITELRDLTNARLERGMQALWPRFIRGDLPAMREYRKLLADFRRHNGLDAPVQVQVSSGAESRLADALNDATQVILGMVTESHTEPADPPALEA